MRQGLQRLSRKDARLPKARDTIRMSRQPLLAVASLALSSALAWADGADLAAGRAIADQNCARCHAIGKDGESPYAPAPPFRTFADNWPVEHLEEALAEGLVVGHKAMPEFTFSPTEIRDFIAYLKSLERP